MPTITKSAPNNALAVENRERLELGRAGTARPAETNQTKNDKMQQPKIQKEKKTKYENAKTTNSRYTRTYKESRNRSNLFSWL